MPEVNYVYGIRGLRYGILSASSEAMDKALPGRPSVRLAQGVLATDRSACRFITEQDIAVAEGPRADEPQVQPVPDALEHGSALAEDNRLKMV